MFRLAFRIGLKYTRAKQRNHFISFISLISVLGIMMGVMVLITVLSVMNGFDHQIKTRILSMVPQLTVTNFDGQLKDWNALRDQLLNHHHIVAAAPVVQGQAMMSYAGNNAYSVIEGIDPTLQKTISPIEQKMTIGSLKVLVPHHFNIILGQELAANLGVTIGDKVMVFVPKATLTPMGMVPRLKAFTVAGIFHVSYQFDNSYALINYQDAQALLQLGNQVSGLQLKLTNLFEAPLVSQQLMQSLPVGYQAMDWTQQNANFFQALKMEKTMMFLILALIIAVAAFNLLASLVMVVTDKQSDIAILRTLGAKTSTLMTIFVVQGTIVGLFGVLVGDVLGVLLSYNVTSLVNKIQAIFHVQFLSSSVYYISFVPSLLNWSDVWHVSAVAIVLSILATIYPAFRASRVHPARALRYE